MYFGEEVENAQKGQQSGGAHAAIQELLVSAASASGAERVFVVSSPDSEGKRTIVAAPWEVPDFAPATYEPGEADTLAELLYKGRTIGCLVFSGGRSRIAQAIVDAYASAAGFVIGYADELAEMTRSSEESEVLRQLGLRLGEPTDLSQMLDSTVDGVRQLLRADYAAVATISHDGTSRWIAMSGNQTDSYLHTVFPPGQGTAARVIESRTPLRLQGFGTSPDLRAEEFPIHVAEGGVSAFTVPIMIGGEPFGALIVGSRKPRNWSEHDMELAAVLGNGAAVAISQVQESAAERAQRAFFEKVIEDFPGVLVVMAPPEFRIVRANSAFRNRLVEPYRSGEPLIGRTLRELSPSGWDGRSDATLALLQRVADTGEPVSFQQYPTEDAVTGEQRYWNWTAAPVSGTGDDQPLLVMLIAQDITELVIAQQKEQRAGEVAHARAEELETVIRQMADGVIIFDSSGNIVKFNPASVDLLGHELVAAEERTSFPELFGLYTEANELYESDQLPSSRALRGETIIGAPLVVKRANGDEAILSASAAPLKDSAGAITGAVTVLRDITQDKLAERLKDEFLSVVSHELRTPLSAIMGYSDLMLRGVHGALSERQARALGAVRSNADRLLHLINDLLDVSRFESGAVPLDIGPVNLGMTISRILTQTKVLVVNAGLTVRNDVPQQGFPLVLADEPRLQQVIENLLSNAIKFTPVGGSIIFSARLSSLLADDESIMDDEMVEVVPSDAQSVVISVSDTGSGLESDQLSRIWDRFYQVDTSAKRRSGGAGLGLAIVRGLVELHGGQIRATSEGPSRGTRFSFSLPIADNRVMNVTQPDRAKDQAVAFRSRGVEDPNALTVLVVEDDEDQREIICDMLEMEGYHVVLAQDGEEAVELAQALSPSAIALDVMLPRSDGWEVLSRLKTDASTRDIPVLIISVVDQQDFGRKLGADEYLIKPLEAGSLRSAVRRLTRNES